ncbi:MAG: hypothetical protein J1F38_07385 [Muribaculaceae bacterium]|nr:hypothetical protein [Muribaculaceae bacterium]
MKKFLISLCGGLLLLTTACNSGYKEKALQDSLRIAELTSDYEEAATFNDSLMLLMADIYNGLDSINMQEGLLYNMGNGETNRRAEVRRNLSAIKERLATNQQLLQQMERRMNETGSQNAVLSRMIEQMKSKLESQESHIAMLENKLSSANDSISNLNTQLAEKEIQVQVQTEAKDAAFNALNEADQQLNTVYYAMGNNKELKQNGLLSKKFLGATKVLEGDVNLNYFTKADKRTLTSIPTGAKKIKIWTNMPDGSYQEIKNDDKTITLKITNPEEFWTYSQYLIIQLD